MNAFIPFRSSVFLRGYHPEQTAGNKDNITKVQSDEKTSELLGNMVHSLFVFILTLNILITKLQW